MPERPPISGHDQSPPARDASLDVWAGEPVDAVSTPTQVPVVLSVAFGYHELEPWLDAALGNAPGHIYSRNTNPTVAAFEAKVRALDRAESTTSFSSGMAAISNTLFGLLSPGGRVVSVKDTYGGTSKLFLEILPRFGVQVTLCETGDHEAIEQAIGSGCDVAYLETPTNPTLKVLDLGRLTAAARSAGALSVVDNTFATPINQRPLELGADLVIHSATKFLGGHADALGGVLSGRADLVRRVFHFREITGAALDPMSAYLLLRGMKTLHLRIAQQNTSALAIARWLQRHPAVQAVFYPGLETHPGHEVARRQMRGFGGVLSFALNGGSEAVPTFLQRLRLIHRAVEERAALGIPEGLVRYSVGIEAAEDLIADLEQALAALA
jgi:cystathionine gamma-synthase